MKLSDFFKENNKAAIAFSGGADSSYLLYAALHYGAKVRAYYVNSVFQPQFEMNDALRFARELNADIKILEDDILSVPETAKNGKDRCYFCKKHIFSVIAKATSADGFSLILDGTNASDEEANRPGMRVLRETSVCSPLRLCNLNKAQIRRLSKEAGLFTWDKPSYSCLATRIHTGEKITEEKLKLVENAENYFFSLGFTDFRIRVREDEAKIQLKESQKIGRAHV